MSGRSEYRVEAQIHVGDDVAQQDGNHVIAGVWKGSVAGTEEIQDGIQKNQGNDGKCDTDDKIQ